MTPIDIKAKESKTAIDTSFIYELSMIEGMIGVSVKLGKTDKN